jgi:hypothetical protein
MKRTARWFLVAGIATLLAGAPGRADAAIAYVLTNTTGIFGIDAPITVGFQFTTNQAITVTDLGIFDSGQNGLAERHEIGIFNSGGTLLASAFTDAGTVDPLLNQFRYVPISPLVLAGGQDYRIGAFYLGSDLVVVGFGGATGFATDPAITFVGDRYSPAPPVITLSDPTSSFGANPGLFGPNFQFTTAAVPEPSTLALTGLGMLGIFGWLRRRKKSGGVPRREA